MSIDARLEEQGGVDVHDLYELQISKPTPKTFHLAKANLSGIDGHDWFGIVESTSGAMRVSALGGGGQGRFSFALKDDEGTYGPGGGRKRFSAHFCELVPGFGEPYDLASARLLVRAAVKERDGSWSVRDVAFYKIDPESFAVMAG